jgi:DNA-binding MarR family transcriptional regulator
MSSGTKKPWAKHSPILEERAFIGILRAADRLERQIAGMFKQYDLTPTQYNALRILRGGGPTGLACGQIGDRMISRDPDITRLLDRLKRRGLISRRRGHYDRRIIKTFITPSGLELLARMDRPVEQFHLRALRDVNKHDLRGLIGVLEKLPSLPRAANNKSKSALEED